MDTFRIFRIGLIIALVFVTGIATGRFTAPAAAAPAPGRPTFEVALNGQPVTARGIFRRLDQDLKFGPLQQPLVLGDIQAMLDEMAATPAATNERFEVIRKFRAKTRAILRADQTDAFDRMVEKSEVRMKELLDANAARK